MKAYRLLHQITLRFSAMDESEALTLNTEAENAYNETLQQARIQEHLVKSAEEENLKHAGEPGYPKAVPVLKANERLIIMVDKWYARYGFAIAYIILVPIVKRMMEGGDDEEAAVGDDAAEFARAFMMFNRHKKI